MRTILIADDSEQCRELLRTVIEHCGHRVVEAMNGRDAIALARQTRPDLLILDLQMPLIDGFAAVAELRRDPQLAGKPVVALTALAMLGDRERALGAGFSSYLSKPVKISSLRAEIDKFLP